MKCTIGELTCKHFTTTTTTTTTTKHNKNLSDRSGI
jgi:hypothetical protein